MLKIVRYTCPLCIFLLFCFTSSAQQAFVIRDVTVIPMSSNKTLNGQDVFIRNGRIEKIEKTSGEKNTKDYTVIDGRKKYLLPGFFDMHAHFLYEQGMPMDHTCRELNLMLTNGITTVRIMNGGDVYKDFLSRHPKKNYPSFPDVELVSPQFVGEWPWKNDTLSPKQLVQTPADAAAAVTKYRQQGYKAIKIAQFIRPEQYRAIISQAKIEGMGVVGHVGPWVKLPAALAAGQQIEHLDEFVEMLLPDSLRRKGMVSVSDIHIWKEEHWPSIDHLDESRIPALVKAVKDAGIYVTPTNYFFAANFANGQSEEEIRSLPEYKYIPAQLLEERAAVRRHWINKKISPSRRARWIGLRGKIIYQLNKAGVPLMCGSDAPAWYMLSGFAVHNELENLAQCGLTPYEALRTATVNPARYLGVYGEKGSIEEGKIADLILLDADPLTNISNSRKIVGVFNHGVYFCGGELQELRDISFAPKENAMMSDGQLAWIEDLDSLQSLLLNRHAFVNWADPKASHKIQVIIGQLKNELLTNTETDTLKLATGMLLAIAALKDGHTSAHGITSRFGMVPMSVRWFSEGIFITGAPEWGRDMIGGRVVSVNDVPVEKYLARLREVVPHGNDYGFQNFFAPYFLSPGIAAGLGMGLKHKALKLEIIINNKRSVHHVDALYSRQGWPVMLDGKKNKSTSDEQLSLWSYQLLSDHSLLISIRLLADDGNRRFETFVNTVDSFITIQQPKKLIIDIRDCPGGNNFNNRLLIKLVHKHKYLNQPARLYVLTGAFTYSAAVTLRADFETKTEARFGGQPAGDRVNHPGDARTYQLPRSGFRLQVSDYFWCYTQDDDGRETSPVDLPHESSYAEWASGQDVLLEKIRSLPVVEVTRGPALRFSGLYKIANDVILIENASDCDWLNIKGAYALRFAGRKGDTLLTTSPFVKMVCTGSDTLLIFNYGRQVAYPMHRIDSLPPDLTAVFTTPVEAPLRLNGNNLAYRAIMAIQLYNDATTARKLLHYAQLYSRKPELAARILSRMGR